MKKNVLQLVILLKMVMISFSLQSMIDLSKIDRAYTSFVMAVGQRPVAYVEEEMQQNLLALHKQCFDYKWSDLYDRFCKDMQEGANVLLHEQMVKVIDECLDFFQQQEGKNSLWKQELVDIKVSLQDYKQFLTSERSMVDASSLLATKKKCCPVPAQRCVDISPYLSFLPTSPILPVTGNFFYAYRQILTPVTITVAPQIIPFTAVGTTSSDWSFTSSTDFTALASGVFLVSVIIPYEYDSEPGTVVVYLEPTLDDVVIPFTPVFFLDGLYGADVVNTLQLIATFIVSVTAGQVLKFQDHSGTPIVSMTRVAAPASGATNPNNGSVAIVRIA